MYLNRRGLYLRREYCIPQETMKKILEQGNHDGARLDADTAGKNRSEPGRRNSGWSEPQLHISKEGDPYLNMSWLSVKWRSDVLR